MKQSSQSATQSEYGLENASQPINWVHSRFTKNLTPEDEILFLLTRQHFKDDHRESVYSMSRRHKINWESLCLVAELHGVAPLIFSNLRQLPKDSIGLTEALQSYLQQLLMRNMLRKETLLKNLARGLAFFRERSIDVMLLKGAALDHLVYNQPVYTVLADADVALSIQREEISEETFREFGHFFHRRGIEYDFFEHHDVTMNGALPVNFRNIWDRAVKTSFRGHDVFVMKPEDMLISLCINSCRKRFFRLKSLCDIAETINRFPEIDWDELIGTAVAYQCHNIVYTALLVTKITVGCNIPDTLLESLKINPARRAIIHFLISKMSVSAFASLYSEEKIMGRSIDWALMLPYSTFTMRQIWRRITFVLWGQGHHT